MMKLDNSQMKFVESEAENIRLLAPAGSGKTLTLLYRCKHLLDQNPQQRILVFTFTRVARSELRTRLARSKELAKYADRIKISTLNSYGQSILNERPIAPMLLTKKMEKKGAFRRLLREGAGHSATIREKGQDRKWVNRYDCAVMNAIDVFKSLGFDHVAINDKESFKEYVARLEEDGIGEKVMAMVDELAEMGFVSEVTGGREKRLDETFNRFFKFYRFVCRRMEACGEFTLEDQKYWGWRMTKDAEKVTGAARYQHIMVDEFQDINPIDLMFVNALRKRHGATLTIVGDDDQAIYEWRGATPLYILNPDQAFGLEEGEPRFETFTLGTNYRSPKNVVELAQKLIGHNRNRVPKEMKAAREEDAAICIAEESDYDAIASRIEKDLAADGIGKVAVVSRKRSHLLPYQIIFANKGIDFFAAEDLNVFLGDSFADLREVVDFKRMQQDGGMCDPYHLEKAFTSLVNRIRLYPLSKKDENLFADYMRRGNCQSIEDALTHLREMPAGELQRRVGVQNACEVIRLFWESQTVRGMLECIATRFDGMQKDYRRVDDDIFFADPPFGELAAFAARYGKDFGWFGEDIERATQTLARIAYVEDDRDPEADELPKGGPNAAVDSRLHLMTALRTKGKKFDSVYVLHANKDVWPHKKAVSEARMESERRLFYVAVTRAQKKLTFVVDNLMPSDCPSPYLAEMGLEVLDLHGAVRV